MRIEAAATTISWIPSAAITGIVYKMPFEVDLAHYDDPPPDALPDIDAYLARDGARFANRLRAWVEVRDGEIVDFGHTGQGSIGSTTLRLGAHQLRFMAFAFPDLQSARRLSATAVRFEQTAGGRTGVPAPRRVTRAPYVQFLAPLAWSTVAVTVHADGRQEHELAGASPFPRHWLYGPDGGLTHKSATIDYHEWSISAYGRQTPWGDTDSPAVVTDSETALERQLSLQIMRGASQPKLRRLQPQERLTTQDEVADEVYLLLDGVLRVDVDGEPVAEFGPGAVVGERAGLEAGKRTATLVAVTRCLVAVADPQSIDTQDLRELSEGHHREEGDGHGREVRGL
jgi:hypothetical protein